MLKGGQNNLFFAKLGTYALCAIIINPHFQEEL